MSVRLADSARAFNSIAHLLEVEQRDEIAKALGERLLAQVKPSSAPRPERRQVAETLPAPDQAQYDETAKFLVNHGYSSADLVRAAGRLEEFIKHHPNLTRVAAMQKWLIDEAGMSR
jgi:hypothetical protein